MKPADWIIQDIKAMRGIENKSPAQDAYLSLLLWYVRVIQGKEG